MHTKDPGTSLDHGIAREAAIVPNGNPAPRSPDKPTTLAGRLLAVLHGDKYMMNAYPPQWRGPGATPSETPPADASSELATEADGAER